MSSYFPVPRDFSINFKNKEVNVYSSINLFNFPNNSTSKALLKNDKKDIFFSLYKLEDYQWIKVSDHLCEYGDSLLIKRDDIDIEPENTLIIIPSSNNNNPSKTNILPHPHTLRIDNSPVNERASYNFTLGESKTSYLGELPYELAKSNKSFFSSDILRLDADEKTKCFFMLMNIHVSSKENKIHELFIFNSTDRKIIQKYFIKSNSFDVYSLPKVDNIENYGNLFMSCKTASFIPIFITAKVEKNLYEISVEHTHPPHELFLGVERFNILSRLRNNWIIK